MKKTREKLSAVDRSASRAYSRLLQIQKSMSLEYEPAAESLHISVK